MTAIPDAFHDLFEKRTFAHVATLTEETDPHVTPVWIGYDADDDRLLVNTERGRRKERNVREDPSVGVSMVDPENPYRRLSIIGEVEEITTEGAREHIDELAQRYTGEDEYGMPIETERVILRIRVDEVVDAQDTS
ncbi:PPOX class putative F420-dependent enzyme [Haloterrigena turkmenica DSM 5511]|uniref:PPOX class putative F420-dependent enzyme n=1 Tax=Haloterrigena turkmenica (strain ATCC 51198 / DSM 5511 / JCM 9101 / NCIMB 13204 / VKM B-1734 / 4k) TaxID=543526 RepID=D2RX15_HALTV|nr:PPOX class F420-dependent oxidoreductase [Haloterrigena turkmenica]ADB59627.1 PPOX class putative F420-dependent enzyme [Haloterrigena turkmenica DSM 5511]